MGSGASERNRERRRERATERPGEGTRQRQTRESVSSACNSTATHYAARDCTFGASGGDGAWLWTTKSWAALLTTQHKHTAACSTHAASIHNKNERRLSSAAPFSSSTRHIQAKGQPGQMVAQLAESYKGYAPMCSLVEEWLSVCPGVSPPPPRRKSQGQHVLRGREPVTRGCRAHQGAMKRPQRFHTARSGPPLPLPLQEKRPSPSARTSRAT